ncbi:sulfate anion transporter [Macrolepiota fuliginosa MF-IS2]|uniref:Sulfate anion transporter n=1 Tax=Macrolepiota fuliginosa MF-IS2 TaxID=1400762 RepID=A0A9P5X6Q3_9AGAR|nr:sulfate anion transporter [Macrolepiota fuliginosa MF-IS2]
MYYHPNLIAFFPQLAVQPFFHMIANSIAADIGAEHPREIIATTLVAFALSSILTGLSFFALGALKLGVIIGFFPRHILVGCIGGVGAFLIETGLTVSMRMSEEDFTMTLETLRTMFLNPHMLALWTIPLVLAIFLRFITHKYHHQLIFPLYFMAIPIIFYIIVAAAGLPLGDLRREGWLFDSGSASQVHWYEFYTYFDYRLVRFGPLWSTLPTQFALLFFNILHPPLNVPALAVSLYEDVDTDKELVGHGYSNLLSGLVGSVPNYLVYVNTLLFYRVGGDNRIAGFLLVIATAILLFVGTGPIAYLPVVVVGALIYVLGIDLVKEALWDTRHRVSRMEYITIVSIMIMMTVFDFVIGVLFGIVVSCFFFVVQNSQRKSIRAIHTGDTTMSAVRRPSLQRAYIRDVAKQTTILRLQGFLFFGTITHVEETIRNLLERPSWQESPIRFLVVDFTLVAGVDMSAAEAFVRIQRLLSARSITLVFCGFTPDSAVGKALQNVDVLGAEGVELFSTLNDAMEWTENAYLRSWFRSHKIEGSSTAFPMPVQQDSDADLRHISDSSVRSPRRSYVHTVGNRTIGAEIAPRHPSPEVTPEPLNTLIKAFSSNEGIDAQRLGAIVKYFSKIVAPAGHVLWRQGDSPDGLYIIESGVLRATYEFAAPTKHFEESMVPGTVAGELSALSNSPRNATCTVEHNATMWKLSMQGLDKLRQEELQLSALFTQLVLKAAKTDYDILLSAIASRQ